MDDEYSMSSGSLIKTFSKLVSDIDAYECEALSREIEVKERTRKELSVKISSMEKHLNSYVKRLRDHIHKIEQTGNAKIAWIRRLEKRKREEIEQAVSVLAKRSRPDDKSREEKKHQKKQIIPIPSQSSPHLPQQLALINSKQEKEKNNAKSPSRTTNDNDSTFSDASLMASDFMDDFSAVGEGGDGEALNADELYF